MKILILVDLFNDWALHNRAKAIKKFLPQHHIEIRAVLEQDALLGHEDFDVLHFNFTWGLTEFTNFILEQFERCVITIVNERSLLEGGGVRPEELIAILKKCPNKTAVNQKMSEMTDSVYIPNGIDGDLFPEPRRLIVGYSGTDLKTKNMSLVETVCNKMNYIFRPAADRRSLKDSKPDFTHERMVDYYKSIDVYVHASLTEGFSNSVLEACACNVPVLMTKQGAWQDFIGWVEFIEPTVESIASGLQKFSARTLVNERFLWRDIIPEYEKMYLKVGSGHR